MSKRFYAVLFSPRLTKKLIVMQDVFSFLQALSAFQVSLGWDSWMVVASQSPSELVNSLLQLCASSSCRRGVVEAEDRASPFHVPRRPMLSAF